MGRHSAPDDEDPVLDERPADATPASSVATVSRGRHARAEEPHPEPVATPVRGAHATRHDLALVMSHGDVRARALAAVLVPFIGYVVVLVVIDALAVHSLVWLWAPAVVAGVLVGLVLDAGHRRYPAPGEGEPENSA